MIDPDWNSLIATSPFPEYTSGHSTQSGAVATVLTDLFGPLSFMDEDITGTCAPRGFNDCHEADHEAAISRLYGGIHYRAAIEHGVDLGNCVGGAILPT